MSIHLSPTENHKHLLSREIRSHSFDHGDVPKWQRRLRRELRKLVGEMPGERCSLRPRTLWKRRHPLGTIEKIRFTSETHADVVGYVCIPAAVKPPYTFTICLQGHSTGMHNSIAVKQEDETQAMEVEGDRDFALGCMRRGIAALCIEQRSMGERLERKQKLAQGCHDAAMQAMMLGRTLIGERVYDVDRGIDYLASRGDANMNCVGVMGNSGGGTVSLFSAALLPRIAFAMPSACFCTFQDSIMATTHCSCNYIPGLLKIAEMSDIMALFAPKPVVIVSGKEDKIFPIHGSRRAFKNLQRVYEACGAVNRCHLVVGHGGHRFYADEAWPVMLREIVELQQKRST